MVDLITASVSDSLLSVSVAPVAVGGPLATVALSGELDRSNEQDARLAIERLLKIGVTCLVVDLGRLRFMDSSGINVLVRAYNVLVQRHGSLALVAPSGPVRRVLEIVRFTALVPVYPTLQQALADLMPAAPHTMPADALPTAPA